MPHQPEQQLQAGVKSLMLESVRSLVAARIAALKSMRRTLAHLAERCDGDERPDCPIIDDLAGIDDLARIDGPAGASK